MQATATVSQQSEAAVPTQASKTKEAVNAATSKLIEALKAGHSETLKQYLAAMAQFHRYSLNNVLLIVSQRPNATRCAGFQTWKSWAAMCGAAKKAFSSLRHVCGSLRPNARQIPTNRKPSLARS